MRLKVSSMEHRFQTPSREVAAIGSGEENVHATGVSSNHGKQGNYARVPLRNVSENLQAATPHSHLLSGAKRVAVKSPRANPSTRETERHESSSGGHGGRSSSRPRGNFMRPTESSRKNSASGPVITQAANSDPKLVTPSRPSFRPAGVSAATGAANRSPRGNVQRTGRGHTSIDQATQSSAARNHPAFASAHNLHTYVRSSPAVTGALPVGSPPRNKSPGRKRSSSTPPSARRAERLKHNSAAAHNDGTVPETAADILFSPSTGTVRRSPSSNERRQRGAYHGNSSMTSNSAVKARSTSTPRSRPSTLTDAMQAHSDYLVKAAASECKQNIDTNSIAAYSGNSAASTAVDVWQERSPRSTERSSAPRTPSSHVSAHHHQQPRHASPAAILSANKAAKLAAMKASPIYGHLTPSMSTVASRMHEGTHSVGTGVQKITNAGARVTDPQSPAVTTRTSPRTASPRYLQPTHSSAVASVTFQQYQQQHLQKQLQQATSERVSPSNVPQQVDNSNNDRNIHFRSGSVGRASGIPQRTKHAVTRRAGHSTNATQKAFSGGPTDTCNNRSHSHQHLQGFDRSAEIQNVDDPFEVINVQQHGDDIFDEYADADPDVFYPELHRGILSDAIIQKDEGLISPVGVQESTASTGLQQLLKRTTALNPPTPPFHVDDERTNREETNVSSAQRAALLSKAQEEKLAVQQRELEEQDAQLRRLQEQLQRLRLASPQHLTKVSRTEEESSSHGAAREKMTSSQHGEAELNRNSYSFGSEISCVAAEEGEGEFSIAASIDLSGNTFVTDTINSMTTTSRNTSPPMKTHNAVVSQSIGDGVAFRDNKDTSGNNCEDEDGDEPSLIMPAPESCRSNAAPPLSSSSVQTSLFSPANTRGRPASWAREFSSFFPEDLNVALRSDKASNVVDDDKPQIAADIVESNDSFNATINSPYIDHNLGERARSLSTEGIIPAPGVEEQSPMIFPASHYAPNSRHAHNRSHMKTLSAGRKFIASPTFTVPEESVIHYPDEPNLSLTQDSYGGENTTDLLNRGMVLNATNMSASPTTVSISQANISQPSVESCSLLNQGMLASSTSFKLRMCSPSPVMVPSVTDMGDSNSSCRSSRATTVDMSGVLNRAMIMSTTSRLGISRSQSYGAIMNTRTESATPSPSYSDREVSRQDYEQANCESNTVISSIDYCSLLNADAEPAASLESFGSNAPSINAATNPSDDSPLAQISKVQCIEERDVVTGFDGEFTPTAYGAQQASLLEQSKVTNGNSILSPIVQEDKTNLSMSQQCEPIAEESLSTPYSRQLSEPTIHGTLTSAISGNQLHPRVSEEWMIQSVESLPPPPPPIDTLPLDASSAEQSAHNDSSNSSEPILPPTELSVSVEYESRSAAAVAAAAIRNSGKSGAAQVKAQPQSFLDIENLDCERVKEQHINLGDVLNASTGMQNDDDDFVLHDGDPIDDTSINNIEENEKHLSFAEQSYCPEHNVNGFDVHEDVFEISPHRDGSDDDDRVVMSDGEDEWPSSCATKLSVGYRDRTVSEDLQPTSFQTMSSITAATIIEVTTSKDTQQPIVNDDMDAYESTDIFDHVPQRLPETPLRNTTEQSFHSSSASSRVSVASSTYSHTSSVDELQGYQFTPSVFHRAAATLTSEEMTPHRDIVKGRVEHADDDEGDPIATQLLHMGSQFALSRIERSNAYDTGVIFLPLGSNIDDTSNN